MARINIEDSLWKDERFQDLMIKVGSRHAAKGMVVELWTLAQEYWFPEKKLIPADKIKRAGLDAVVEVGLAEVRESGIFAIGADTAFGWLFQRQDAGKKGGRPSKTGKRPKATAKRPKAAESGRQAGESGENPLTPSPSLPLFSSSSSGSTSDSEYNSVGDGAEAHPVVEIKNPVGFFIATYVKAYQKRYPEARPDLTGKIQGKVKTYVGEVPIERACEMIRMYCEMNDPWFLTKCHDFGTFIENLSKVGVALDGGRTLTQAEIRQMDRKQTNLNAWGPVIADAEAKEAANG